MDNSTVNIDLIRDHVDTIILSTLANGDRYGLDILTEIRDNSKGLYELKQPTLYSCLKRLEKLGYITSYKGDTSNGAQRVYYSLLDDGRKFLENDQYQWEYSRTIINGLLSSKDFDPNQEPPFNASDLRPRTKRQPRSELSASDTYVENMPQILVNSSDEEDSSTPYVASINENANSADNSTDGTPFVQNIGPTIKIASTNPDLKTVIVNKDSTIYAENVDYVGVFENIFSSDNKLFSAPNSTTNNYSYNEPGYSSYNQNYSDTIEEQDYLSQYSLETVTKKFENQGFTLKPYLKKNTTEYYVNKYLYINKILMVTSMYSYLLFALALTIMHLCTFNSFGTSAGSLFGTLGAGLLFPIYFSLNYLVSPTKRVLADFSLKKTMSVVSIFLINAFLIVIIVGFVVFGATFKNIPMLVKTVIFPTLLILLVPCCILLYSWLYNSTHYHVN